LRVGFKVSGGDGLLRLQYVGGFLGGQVLSRTLSRVNTLYTSSLSLVSAWM
jgi:hypothetical protein